MDIEKYINSNIEESCALCGGTALAGYSLLELSINECPYEIEVISFQCKDCEETYYNPEQLEFISQLKKLIDIKRVQDMPNKGWREFQCDDCSFTWTEATRDCTTPSSSECPICNQDGIRPHLSIKYIQKQNH